ncbi:Rmf/CrpP family protein [Streptomyces sp. Je 1-332]
MRDAPKSAGREPTVCPYPRTSRLRTAWIRGNTETCPLSSRHDDGAD